MSTFSERRLAEISREIVVDNQYDIRRIHLDYITEALWLENLPPGCSVNMFPSSTGKDSYFLFVNKPEKGDEQHA